MQKSYSVENLLEIEGNKSSKGVGEMVNVCKRLNNNKRDYLFVNSLQGKHIPQEPSKVISVYEELLQEVEKGIDKKEKVVVIGFAETATAIGQYIGQNLSNCVYILQTTREELVGKRKIIEFEEEHSHAVGQWIYAEESIPEYDRVLFVEDEITTGNTIRNFIKEFKKKNKTTKYSVASILNWQNASYTDSYKEEGIDTYYLVKGSLKECIEPITVQQEDYKTTRGIKKVTKLTYKYKTKEIEGQEPGKCKAAELAEHLELLIKGKDICVIGTEEYMYTPLMVGKELEKGRKVKFHATTRSPIVVSKEDGYAIREGIRIKSIYEDTRTTYLYNTRYYDTIVLITNTKATESFIEGLKLETDELIIVELEG